MNVTLDGCCDPRAIPADEELHRHGAEILDGADALLFGRVTYKMMQAAFRQAVPPETAPDGTDPFARTINAAKKYTPSPANPCRVSRRARGSVDVGETTTMCRAPTGSDRRRLF